MNPITNKRRITWRALRYALTNATNRLFYGAVIFFLVAAWGCVYFEQYGISATLALLGIGGFGLLVSYSVLEYNTAEANNKFAMLTGWANDAKTDEERARRKLLLENNSLDEAWEHSLLKYDGPRYNVDGTLMLPGHSIFDIRGNVYGSTDLSSASFNPNTNTWTDPASAYGSPLDGGGVHLDTTGANGFISDSSTLS